MATTRTFITRRFGLTLLCCVLSTGIAVLRSEDYAAGARAQQTTASPKPGAIVAWRLPASNDTINVKENSTIAALPLELNSPPEGLLAAEALELPLASGSAPLRAIRLSDTSNSSPGVWRGRILGASGDGVAEAPASPDVTAETPLANDGQVFLAVHNGILTGSILLPDALYEIRPQSAGYQLIKHGREKFLMSDTGSDSCGTKTVPALAADTTRITNPAFVSQSLAAESGDLVDLLVVYTRAARDFYGGAAQTEAQISTMTSFATFVFQTSQIRTQFRMLPPLMVNYQETGNSSLDLDWLRADPTVTAYRNQHKADVIVLLTEQSDVCGKSYVFNGAQNAANGTALVRRNCFIVGSNTFPHEIGHTFGAKHGTDHPDSAGPGGAVAPYAYGYGVQGNFATIMGSQNTPNCGVGCRIIFQFSNPRMTYRNDPTGIVNIRDNSRALDESRVAVANFRVNETPPTPTPTPTGAIQFSVPVGSVAESAGVAHVTVNRIGDTSGTATVDFATLDNTASQRADYSLTFGTVTFTPGQATQTIAVPITPDSYVEGDETLNLTLFNPQGAIIGTPAGSPFAASTSFDLIISDDDQPGQPPNPIATPSMFAQQQYFDFLAREPDAGGLQYWTEQTAQCGSDRACLIARRTGVSNTFFTELEYQRTGAYVFRLYRAAFGNLQPGANTATEFLPPYSAFAADRSRIDARIQNLAASQRDLAAAFVGRAAFIERYSSAQTAEQFVDAVLANIQQSGGLSLSSQRTALINLYNTPLNGISGRAAVLYRLADDDPTGNLVNNRAFIDAEYNRAFVATQYFGYLRRDPDLGGYNFWLGVVNAQPLGSMRGQSLMVCVFITSQEYLERFGTDRPYSNADCP